MISGCDQNVRETEQRTAEQSNVVRMLLGYNKPQPTFFFISICGSSIRGKYREYLSQRQTLMYRLKPFIHGRVFCMQVLLIPTSSFVFSS